MEVPLRIRQEFLSHLCGSKEDMLTYIEQVSAVSAIDILIFEYSMFIVKCSKVKVHLVYFDAWQLFVLHNAFSSNRFLLLLNRNI